MRLRVGSADYEVRNRMSTGRANSGPSLGIAAETENLGERALSDEHLHRRGLGHSISPIRWTPYSAAQNIRVFEASLFAKRLSQSVSTVYAAGIYRHACMSDEF